MKPKILVIGSSNTDMIIRTPRIPLPGETILGGAFSTVAGGKGANQAVAAARAGGDVTFVARLGNDQFGQTALEGYRQDRIKTDYIIMDDEFPTGVAIINVSDNGENSISVASGANARLTPNDIEQVESLIADSQVLLIQLETPLPTVKKAIDLAHKHGVSVILNPAPAMKLNGHILNKVDVITPNETETALLTELPVETDSQIEAAAAKLKGQGVKSVVVTLGARGVYYHNNMFRGFAAGFPVKAIDTTAAGDTFNGYLAVALASGVSIKEAIRRGNAAAALSVQRPGAQTSIPTQEEMEHMLTSI